MEEANENASREPGATERASTPDTAMSAAQMKMGSRARAAAASGALARRGALLRVYAEEPKAAPTTSEPLEAAAAPAEAAAPAAPKQEEGLDFFKLMGAGGPAPEVINGRAAMLGFLAAVGAELATQDSIFKQLGEGGAGGMLFVFAAVTAASFAPIFNGQDAQKSFLKNSQPEEFGPFNAQAEMLNGRAAMMGLLFLLAAEASQGQAFF